MVVHFQRSPVDRPNPSCVVNLRRGNHEADLLAWESGEGDLAVVGAAGSAPAIEHHDNLKNDERLSAVLVMMLQAIDYPGPNGESGV